jgi:CheY-like chemotaxis protein
MKASIVIADDEENIRYLLTILLRRYTLYTAATGEDALTLIREHQPDVAILDVMMPHMSGLEVAVHLKADFRTASIPLILLSAKGQATDIEEGYRSGIQRYIVKPFDTDELQKTVDTILQSSIKKEIT